MHKQLEEANPTSFTEESFSHEVCGKTVTGRVDLYDMAERTLTDYKTASVWKVMFGDFEDWRRQGLIYAWLMDKSGLQVDKCRFVAMLRDWSRGEAGRKAGYPQSQVHVYEFEVGERELEEAGAFVRKKVAELLEAEALADDDIPPCSPEERWEKPATWAVMKAGRKTALRVFDTKEAAETQAAAIDGAYVEERKGTSARCEGYCLAAGFCSFAKGLKGGKVP